MTISSSAGRRFVLSVARQASIGLAFALGVLVVPHRWCMRDADRWYARDPVLQESLARGVERFVRDGVGLGDFDTGHAQFNGEWLFGTYLMAGFGFGQLALAHPERRDHYLPLLEFCLDQLQTPEVREFDRASWQRDPSRRWDPTRTTPPTSATSTCCSDCTDSWFRSRVSRPCTRPSANTSRAGSPPARSGCC
jgi:hypothetical protein